MWFKKLFPSPILLWYELANLAYRESQVLQLCYSVWERFLRGWCDVREAFSNPVNSSCFPLSLSSAPPTLSFHCSHSHFIPIVVSPFPGYKWYLCPPYLITPSSSLTVLVISPLHPNSLCIFRFILLHHPISILLTASLFSFPVISSLCYSSHFCSLDQYSVPSSCHQALHHLTHLYPLAGLDVPSSPLVLCIHLGAAKCWIESVNVGPGV